MKQKKGLSVFFLGDSDSFRGATGVEDESKDRLTVDASFCCRPPAGLGRTNARVGVSAHETRAVEFRRVEFDWRMIIMIIVTTKLCWM